MRNLFGFAGRIDENLNKVLGETQRIEQTKAASEENLDSRLPSWLRTKNQHAKPLTSIIWRRLSNEKCKINTMIMNGIETSDQNTARRMDRGKLDSLSAAAIDVAGN
jgi:hypothetical protein